MKEMKGMLPAAKAVREATQSGKTAAETEMKREVPEQYSNHYFTKEAWLQGYDSWDGITTIANEEEMKTFKEFITELNCIIYYTSEQIISLITITIFYQHVRW